MKTLPTADEIRGNQRDPEACLSFLRNAHEARRVEMLSMLDKAGGENRNLLASESRDYNSHETELRKLDLAIDEVEAEHKHVTQARSRFERLGGTLDRREHGNDSERVRAFLNGEVRHLDINLDSVDTRADSRTGAFEVRDLSVGTATAGGNTVGQSFAAKLVEHMVEVSGVRRTNVTVWNTADGEDLAVPKTTAHGTAAIVTEGAAITESDPTFGQTVLEAYKYGTLIEVSHELLADTRIDVVGYLARQAGRAIGNSFGEHAVVGTGTSQPRGVVTGATVGVTGGTGQSGVPTADELHDLYFSVIEPYRSNSYWLMSDATLQSISKIKDADNRYLIQAGGGIAGQPGLTLLGRPIVTDPHVADRGLSAKSIAFGDFSAYHIRSVSNLRFERSDSYAFNRDVVAFRALWRGDGDLVDETGAVKLYQGGAT